MYMKSFNVTRTFDNKEYVLKTPKPAQFPLFARISTLLTSAQTLDEQLLYTMALLGFTLRQPVLDVSPIKRSPDGHITNKDILEYGERVAEALEELSMENLLELVNAMGA